MDRLDLSELGAASPRDAALVAPDGRELTYGELRTQVARLEPALGSDQKALVLIAAPRSVDGLVAYLAALRVGHAVLLADEREPQVHTQLIHAFHPDVVVHPGSIQRSPSHARTALHPSLAMVLRTSGSLGTPKAVRLSFENLRSNALAIASALGIRRDDRGVTSLPLDFGYGLSVVNSHLAGGSSLALTTEAPSSQAFWWQMRKVAVTSLAAVSDTYRLLRRQGWHPRDYPALRQLLHSGGPLDRSTLQHFGRLMAEVDGEFIAMYGQTEATARMAYLPPRLLLAHAGSVGFAVPGGRLRIDGRGEIIYEGPNVMLGYATSRKDLDRGDELGGVLRTGDLGRMQDGLLHVLGRRDRQVKVLGVRLDLAELEGILTTNQATVAVEKGGERLVAAVEGDLESVVARRREAARSLSLPPSFLQLARVDSIPRTARGKVDHQALKRLLDTSSV